MNRGFNFFLEILNQFGWLGNWLFFVIAIIECIPFIGAFFPGGTLISIGGFLASQGYFNPFSLILYGTLGAIAGDYLGYCLGRWGAKYLGDKNIIKPKTLEKGRVFFQKYGNKSIFWGRFIGATRAAVPFIAGASEMKQSTFIIWNASSAFILISFQVAVGYFSGSLIGEIICRWSHRLGLIVIILIILVISYWLIRKHGQSVIDYFKKSSHTFTDKVTEAPLYQYIDKRYPAISELPATERNQEYIFGFFLWVVGLFAIYVLSLIIDLF